MKQSIHILLKIERVHPEGQDPGYCVSWYMTGGGPGYDGQVNEPDLLDALKTVCAAVGNRLDDQPELQVEALEVALPPRNIPTPVAPEEGGES